MNLTELTKEQIEQKYETRSGHDIKITRIGGNGMYPIKGIVLYPSGSVNKSWTKDGTYFIVPSAENTLDLVLKEDRITDEERLVFAMNELTVNDVVKYSKFVLQRGSAGDIGDCREFLDPLIMENRKPKITNTWFVDHFEDGWSGAACSTYMEPSRVRRQASITKLHGLCTHVIKVEIYSNGERKETIVS